ncbi:MAG: hypothetical protein V1720_13565 [bacterium]
MKILEYKTLYRLLGMLLALFLFSSCNEGISPAPEIQQPGFSGTISFIGEWPAGISRTHIVLFKDALQDSSDFNAFNLRFVSNEIPFGTSIFIYNSITDLLVGNVQPGEYFYLAVAQSKTTDISFNRSDWFVVGLFTQTGNPGEPAKLVIPTNRFVENINIVCDFDNPPPQPPGGN